MACIQCSRCGGNVECDEGHCHEECAHLTRTWLAKENKELRAEVETLKAHAMRDSVSLEDYDALLKGAKADNEKLRADWKKSCDVAIEASEKLRVANLQVGTMRKMIVDLARHLCSTKPHDDDMGELPICGSSACGPCRMRAFLNTLPEGTAWWSQ